MQCPLGRYHPRYGTVGEIGTRARATGIRLCVVPELNFVRWHKRGSRLNLWSLKRGVNGSHHGEILCLFLVEVQIITLTTNKQSY